MCPLGSRCLDGIQPAAALLGVVPWKGNQREQEEGWTLRRKRLEEGGEARAKTGCHAALAGRGGSGAPHVAATRSQERRDCVGGQPCLLPPGSLSARVRVSLPSIGFWTPFLDACIVPPPHPLLPLHLFQACLRLFLLQPHW